MANMSPLKGPYEHTGGAAGKHRKVNGQKSIDSRRVSRSSNAGTRTGPLKGPDKGRG